MTESVSYLGRVPAFGDYKKIDDLSSSFNGVLTTFSVTSSGDILNITSDKQCLISLNDVILEPGIDFYVGSSANQLVFSTAPTLGQSFFGIVAGDRLDMLSVSDGAVTNGKLGGGAVSTDKLQDSSVTSAKLSSNSVTSDKIATGAVTNTKLPDNVITIQKISDNAVTSSKIADSAITNSKIADGVITFAKIISSSIATAAEVISATANKLVSAAVLFTLLPKIEVQEVTSVITVNGIIPIDNTRPQITEGTQVATITFTPRSLTEKIKITYNSMYSVSSGLYATFAIFINGDADAVQAFTDIGRNAAGAQSVCISYVYTPTSLTTQTITVRGGVNGGAFYINGDASGGGNFGGSSKQLLMIERFPG